VSELGPNAFGEPVDPGRVDCYLALPLPAEEDEEGLGGVLVVAPRWLLHPAVPQPAGSLVYELVTGHPDRQSRESSTLGGVTVAVVVRSIPVSPVRCGTWVARPVKLDAVRALQRRHEPSQGEGREAATINLPARGVHAGMPGAGIPGHG
jgi:hypothetical protein